MLKWHLMNYQILSFLAIAYILIFSRRIAIEGFSCRISEVFARVRENSLFFLLSDWQGNYIMDSY